MPEPRGSVRNQAQTSGLQDQQQRLGPPHPHRYSTGDRPSLAVCYIRLRIFLLLLQFVDPYLLTNVDSDPKKAGMSALKRIFFKLS